MSNSDNPTQEQIWKKIQHRSAKISTAEQFKRQYLNEERARENRFLWQGKYEKCTNHFGKPIQSVDAAVGRIVFDACWYTNYDQETVVDIIEDSPYSVEDCSDSLKQIMIRAFERQDGGSFGGDHSIEIKKSSGDDDDEHDGDDDDEHDGGNKKSQVLEKQKTNPYEDFVGCGDKIDRNLSKF